MIEDYLVSIPPRFPGASLDTWCLMPNHLHILLGVGVEDDLSPPLPSIPAIMDWFKSATTVEYINGVKNLGWPRFDRYLWQPKYHDRIVRNDRELEHIRDYIANNPANWHDDLHFTEHLQA
jgi:putative transposase